MTRTPGESAQEVLRRNNARATQAVNALSPTSRASLRQQAQAERDEAPPAPVSRKTTPTKDQSERQRSSQGGRREALNQIRINTTLHQTIPVQTA